MRYLAICLLFTATLSFSKNPPSKIPLDQQKSESASLIVCTAIPPVASYLSLKLLNKKTRLDIPAEKRLVEEVGAIGLTQTGLSKSTAEKIARCSVAALCDVRSSHSPSSGIKTAGKTLVSELLLDEAEDMLTIIPFPNTENNILFQSGKLVVKGIARHYLDKGLTNIGDWYPTNLRYYLNIPDLNNESDFFSEEEWKKIVECAKTLTTFFIQKASTKFIAEKLIQTTGKNTYLSVDQLPIITANDVATATVTGITSTAFLKNNPKKTAKLIGKEFVLNKMFSVESNLLKKYWHSGINNSRVIATIDKWVHHHPKIVALPKFLLKNFSIPQINETLFEQLLRSIP